MATDKVLSKKTTLAEPSPPRADDPAACALRAAILRSLERLLENEPGAARGDVEAVHQMRVATRRLRSDLRTFGPLVKSRWANALRDELRWLAGSLGAVRDIDVQLGQLRDAAGDDAEALEPLFDTLAAHRTVARRQFLADLTSPRYGELIDQLQTAAVQPRLRRAANQPAREALPPLAAAAWKRLARAGRRLDETSPDADYHALRILAKRARYAAEAIAPALGDQSESVLAFAHRTADLQANLGALQDAVVAHHWIDPLRKHHPGNLPFQRAAARLHARIQRQVADARQDFPACWKALDRPRLRRWMKKR